jgi:uncharacterized protein
MGGNQLSLFTHFEFITTNNAGKLVYGLIPASMNLYHDRPEQANR